MISRLDIVVRSTEVDTLGHVNNSVYQQWMEWGRFEWVRHADTDFSKLGAPSLTMVVVHVSLDYRHESRRDDRMVIETSLSRLGTKSITYRQRILHANGVVAAEGTVVLAMFDKQTRRSAEIPPAFRSTLEPLVVSDVAGP